jgi:3D (Asp-Asp-Asp) domain-containing protein
MSAVEMKLSMERAWINNRWKKYIPTHIIVWCSWDIAYINSFDKVVWATQNYDANINWIHIEVVWNFNLTKPSEKQYESLRKIISNIESEYKDIEIKAHRDFQQHSCPWKTFDFSKIKWKEIIKFSLSRYYSVMTGQTRYYNWKTYEQDFKMNCWWNCLSTANSTKLTDDMMYKTVACPPEYPLWTKIYLNWIWIVTCNDRGWAIQGNRIDMRCWIWDKALDNWNKCPTWIRTWYVIK